MNIKTRDIVFLLVGLVAIFSSLTGDPPAGFVTSSLKGKKPKYTPIQLPNLSSIQLAPKAQGSNSSVEVNYQGASAAAQSAIRFALAQVGKPYKWGATGPNAYDCSGLVCAAFKSGGVTLPRTTYLQASVGKRVSKADLMPGDLVFPDPGHVQIYLGNGRVVESPHTGAFVRVVNMWGFWTARRITTGGVVSV
jgi:cell wall-associated NlpC family hydrolase